MRRCAFSPMEADASRGAGVSRSAGRVLGGGLTSSDSETPDAEEAGVMRFSFGFAEIDGRL